MRSALNVHLPEEHRVITGIYTVPVHTVRVTPTTKQQLRASRLYVANEREDGIFKVDDETFCVIESGASSFWELVPVVKGVES
jgi:hypothetical protein